LVIDIYDDGASLIFSKYCLCLLGHGQHFTSECHVPQEKYGFAKLYYIAHFESHVQAQGWLRSEYH
jgi:hypothetical protein